MLLRASTSCLFIVALLLALASTFGLDERIVSEADIPAYMLYNEAVALQAKNLPDQALDVYTRALELKPDLAEALLNAGTIVHKLGGYDLAHQYFENAYHSADIPKLKSSALNNIGHLYYTLAGSDFGRIEATLLDFQRAIDIDSTNVDAWYNMGKSLEDLGRWEEAKAAFERVLELDVDHPSAHLSLGNFYLFQGEMDELALHHHRHVINGSRAGGRDVRSALNNIGQLYRLRQEHAAAKATFHLGLQLDPNDAISLCNLMTAQRSLCEWDGLDQLQGQVMEELILDLESVNDATRINKRDKSGQRSLPPYDAMLIPQTSAALQKHLTHAYLSGLQSISRCALSTSSPTPHLRLSYLSYDFRDHVMGHLTRGLLTSHDENRFLVQAASYGPSDDSSTRQRIKAGVNQFTDLSTLGEVEAACGGISRDFHPHIAIDLMGITRGTRAGLAALKPALIMVNYLGYPGTVGSSYMDYIIVDPIIAPAETAAKAFSERLVVLPHTYQANDYSPTHPLAESDIINKSRPITYCNFNHVDKMEPTSFAVWMAILCRSPGSHLNLLEPGGPNAGTIKANLHAEAASRGVLPSRIIFLPRVSKKEHLDRLPESCDLFLDSFAYGAHSTASDALFTALPLMTMIGWGGPGDPLGKFPARVGTSLLHSLDAEEETVTHSPREMEDLTVHIMTRPEAAAIYPSIVSKLRRAVTTSPTFNVASITQNLERGYEGMWEIQQSGLGPQHLIIHPEVRDESSMTQLEEREEERVMGLLLESLKQGDVEGRKASLAISSRLVAAFPHSSDAWHLRGLALLEAGNEDHLRQAPDNIIRAIELRGDVSFYHLNLAEAFLRLGRREDGKKALMGCLSMDPSEVVAVTKLQRLLNEEEAVEEEAELFRWVMPHVLGREEADNDPETNTFLQLHAIARAKVGDYPATVKLLDVATQYFPHDHVAAMRYASALEATGQVDQAIDQFVHAVKLKHQAEFEAWPFWQQDQQQRRSGGKQKGGALPRLAIYCDEYGQSWWGNWGPSSLGQGLGGSEESVIFIAREIAKTGLYDVEVYGSPPASDIGRDPWDVLWLPHQAFDPSQPPQVFVAWRYHISLALAETTPQRYLWLQDLPSFATYTPSFLKTHAQAIFVLSHFHASLLPHHGQSLAVVTPNALDPSFLRNGSNKPWIFVYGSAPNRGLESLLRLWPRIREKLLAMMSSDAAAKHKHGDAFSSPPSPELRIYYGFTAAFKKYARRNMVVPGEYEAWMEEMRRLLQQEGVRYIGMVDHDTLAEGYAEAGFLLYPTTYPETGCVTVMKAMAMGAIPITSRCISSTLPELTGNFDLGPIDRSLHSERPLEEDLEWVELYVDAVVDAASRDFAQQGIAREEEGSVARHRKEMIEWTRQRFLWEKVAKIWVDQFSASAAKR